MRYATRWTVAGTVVWAVVCCLAACHRTTPNDKPGPPVVTALVQAPTAPQPRGPVVRPRLPDVELLDQHGHRHRFDELVAGKSVFLNAIFTSCQATCPMQASIFAQVQRKLGARVGRDVVLVSVSLDPEYDKPWRLREFASRHGGGPGWYLLTGEQQDIVRVLKAMDLYANVPAEHVPMAAVGHEPSGVWRKVLNLKAPIELLQELAVVEDRGRKLLARAAPAR